jgi:hypothetical protein
MRKSILLLSGAGIAAGLVYALTNRNDKQANGGVESAEGGGDRRTGRNEGSPRRGNGNSAGASVAGTAESSGNGASANSGTNSSQPGASMKNLSHSSGSEIFEGQIQVDDRGTDQETASQILKTVRDDAFEGSDEKLALALGRPIEEINGWLDGSEIIDGDVLIKVRALAIQRGVEIDSEPVPAS